VLDKWESKSKPDRGIVYVERRAFNQRGETILTLRRKVLVPKKPENLEAGDWGPETEGAAPPR
jgi:acyl dehydratase